MRKEKKQVKDNIVQYTTEDSRFYIITDKKGKETVLPSVTFILKSLPLGDQLLRWYCDMGYDHAKEYMEERATMGSAVHSACEMLMLAKLTHDPITLRHDYVYEGREISSREWKAILAFATWWKELEAKTTELKVLAVEQTYFDVKLKCAGTVDLVLMIDGVVTVVDLKTSTSIYPSHEVQISTYAKMVADNLKIPLKEVKRKILLLGYSKNKKGYFEKEVNNQLDIFKAVKIIHDHYHGEEMRATIELPSEVSL